MIPAIGETRVSRLLAEQAARFATLTDEEIALSETSRFDARMREWAKGWIEMSPEDRFKAHHGWPKEHRFSAGCECRICNTSALRAQEG